MASPCSWTTCGPHSSAATVIGSVAAWWARPSDRARRRGQQYASGCQAAALMGRMVAGGLDLGQRADDGS
jgi:hypothetical protein